MIKLRTSIAFMIVVVTLLISTAGAQSTPSIEIVLTNSEASQGSQVFADVIIRNGVNIAGADIGVEVTGDCLRVIGREDGNFLPTDSASGGFSPFQELTETSTRLAASITDPTRIQSGDGVFFRVVLEVICESSMSEIEVTFAQLAQIPDLESSDIASLTLDNGELTAESAALTIRPGVVVDEQSVATIVPLPTQAPTDEATPVPTPSPTLVATTEVPPPPIESGDGLLIGLGIAALVVLVMLIALVAFWVGRSSSSGGSKEGR